MKHFENGPSANQYVHLHDQIQLLFGELEALLQLPSNQLTHTMLMLLQNLHHQKSQ